MNKLFFISTLLLIYVNSLVFAQDNQYNCETFLAEIKQLYDNGRYKIITDNIENLINKCSYSTQEQVYLYKYVIATYKTINYNEEYIDYVQKLLQLDPHYRYQTNDPLPLKGIRDFYNIYPKYTLGLIIGTDVVLVNRINVYQVFDSSDATLPYVSLPALNTSFLMQYNLNKRFSLAYDIGFYFSNFTKNITFYNGLLRTSYRESIQGIGNKLAFKINFPFNYKEYKISPYFISGGFFDLRVKITGHLNLSINDTSMLNQYPDFDFNARSSVIYHILLGPKPSRLPFNYGYLLGTGINFISKNTAIFAEILYQRGFEFNNNPKVRFVNPILRNYYYIDDDIILNKVFFRLGLTYSFKYKVVKK